MIFFDGLIRRKLASLLQPWLVQEPEWEVKLGFLRSLVVAKNLQFDTAALNRLIDGNEEMRLSFKSVMVDEVRFQVRHWSAPAFAIEVRGVHVILFPEKRANAGVSQLVEDSVGDYLEERKKKAVAQIDPEGSTLHDSLEKMMMTAASNTSLTNSIENLVLMHCCLHLHDARVRVEFPVSEENFTWQCYTRELNTQSSHDELGCFLGGLIGSIFLPVRETCFNFEACGLEVELEKKDHSSCILSCVNPYIGIRSKDFNLVNFILSVPEMNFSFSSSQVQMMGAFINLIHVERKHIRSGKLLWEMARSKIHNFLLPPGCLLYKVVLVALLWLRLVKEYQSILALVGYFEDEMKMPNGRNFLRAAKRHWKVISEIENELPAEAIASARQVARYRAALKAAGGEDIDKTPLLSNLNCLWRIFLPLGVIWGAILRIFEIIMSIFLLRKTLPNILIGQPGTPEVSDPSYCFHLNFGKISAVISSLDASCPPVQKSNLSNRNSNRDLCSFCLLAKGFFFIYEEGIYEQYTSFSVGFLEITSAPIFDSSENGISSRNVGDAPKGSLKGDDSKTIVWGQPALMCSHSEKGETVSGTIPFSKQMSEEMEVIWKRLYLRSQGTKANYDGSPWAFSDIRLFRVYPGLKSPDSGFLKCSLMVGKLNFALEYSSVLSIATLIGEVQHALDRAYGPDSTIVRSHSSTTVQDFQDMSSSQTIKSCVKGMKMRLFKLLPEKHVQVRALITGPCFQISLRNEELLSNIPERNDTAGSDGVNLTIDVHDTEFFVWPTAISGIACEENHRPNDMEPEFFKSQEHLINGFSEFENTSYASEGQISLGCYLRLGGLNAYFEDLVENHQMQFLLLKPVTVKISSLRKKFHSFARSVVASSLSLCSVMTGVTGLFYMDELSVILQVIERLFSAVSQPPSCYSAQNHQAVVEHEMLCTGTSNMETMIGINERVVVNLESSLLVMDASFELPSLDIILHNSRNNTGERNFSMALDAYDIRKLGLSELPDTGIWLFVQKTRLDICIGEVKAEIVADFRGIHAIIFRYNNQIGNTDKPEHKNAIPGSIDCLHEVSLSSCAFNLLLALPEEDYGELSGADSLTSSSNLNGLLSASFSTTDDEYRSPKSIQDKYLEWDSSTVAQNHWLLINVTIDVIFMGRCSVKNGLLGAHPINKLHFSLSVGGDFQRVCLQVQGGFVFVEATLVAIFAHCLTSYLHCIRSLFSFSYSRTKWFERAQPGMDGSIYPIDYVEEPAQRKTRPAHPVKLELLEALSISLSQISFVLLAADESGIVREIIGSIDLSLKLWLENRRKKFLFNLSHLDVHYQILDGRMEQTDNNIQMPHFSSPGSSYASWQLNRDDASCSSRPASVKQSVGGDSLSSVIQGSGRDGNYILEKFCIFILAEKPFSDDENGQHCTTQGWFGNGSISGLNLTISLSEIQMLMTTVESLSEVSSKDAVNDVKERSGPSITQEYEKDLEAALPDGSIVAIQDVHQHMYVTVESAENRYRLAGAVHYSLVGKRALFKVKWQKQRRWNVSASWFSLMSLYATNDSGEPLRLNYCASSVFVDISSKNDSSYALWKIVPCKLESYEDDVDLDPLSHLSQNTFYLVNKKNDCGAAFVDGALEFIKKPGNPFKFKLFDGLSAAHDLAMTPINLLEAHALAPVEGQRISDQDGLVPCITLTIEKVSLTIVHELSDAKDKFPLLQACINGTDITVQILPLKTRVISQLTVMLYYFDAHRELWRELVHPLEICIYSRSKSHSHVTEISNHGMHFRLYIRMKKLVLSITEPSLDILLYVVGKLDLAGPFAVKSYAILANCCKVENQSQLNLVCYFYDAQSGSVDRRQSAIFFLRRPLVDQPSEAPYVTIKLETPGTSSTTSIRVPLPEPRVFAWRTRIMSLQDARTYPGPFIVFDISKSVEEGLSVTVSPLLRIHNKTGFPVELRIQRPEQMEAESASVLLRAGDVVDDCLAAFDAVNLVGGPKKALLSLSVGNFVFSFRPEMKGDEDNPDKSCSVEWSDCLEGGKAVRLSGIIDKLSYQVRKAFSVESWKYSFSTTSCSVRCGNAHVAKMHFLVQTMKRDVPIVQPSDHLKTKNSSIALQEQKEVFLLPTVRVSNLLESDIDVLFTETEMSNTNSLEEIGNRATVSRGLTVDLYANPATIYFTVTLLMFGSSCKPVNCGQWLKKLSKKTDGIQFLDIDLEFFGGKYFACLRLARGDRGVLEAIVFTQYTLRNDTDFPLFCTTPNMRPLSRDEIEKHGTTTPPHLGSFLPQKSIKSWFLKSSKLRVKLLDEETSESTLDLDALSGLAEISFTKVRGSGFNHLIKLGVSLGPLMTKMDVPSRMISIVPRYLISNESDEQIFVRQCFLEDDLEGTIGISSKQKAALFFRVGSQNRRDVSVFDKLLRKHRISVDDASVFVQFRPDETGLGWSGPVCVASLGHFFLKFKRSMDSPIHRTDVVIREDHMAWEFAVVHVAEEASTFVLRFHKPPDIGLPYRIENHLGDASITFYQKDTFEPETLASGGSTNYVWDDLTRPRKLMVKINGIHHLREISLDKLRPWKRFFRARQQIELASDLPLERMVPVHSNGINVEKAGYEVYADGPTRVLRICHSPGSRKGHTIFQSCKKIQLRISYLAIQLLEHCNQDSAKDLDPYDLSSYTPFIIGRLENVSLDSIFIDQRKYNRFAVQSMNVDEKWAGAPFAAMLRRHQTSSSATDDCILFIVFVLYPTSSNVKEVKYSSIVLQPIDLNLDEETLMKAVPFWRTSLSSITQSQQYYFDHFEIHPVKIIASFLPQDSYSSYSSGQEMLRSFLHSVIKVPAIKNLVVELNGVLVTHALVTTRELLLRCAKHYSWYSMRAIYIAKGSHLLPPSFASVFDDLASSSLDVFFDPSSSLFNVQGLTLGTFKLISKCIANKGFSGTKRYFGDLDRTLRAAGSNILFAALTEISDSVLKGAESSGLNGLVTGFHHGILKLAMEPSLLGTAFMEGGPDRKIKLDQSPGVDELYIEGYLQAMLDTIYKQEYLRVRVIDNQVILKNLPPNSSLIDEIMDRVKDFLVSKALLKGDSSTSSRPLRHLRGENEWRLGPTVLTLCEHLFVSFAIRMLRKQTNKFAGKLKLRQKWGGNHDEENKSSAIIEEPKGKFIWRWGIGKFVLSAMVAYVDGRLCRCIHNPVARRIVSGFLLSFLDSNDSK